MELSDEFIFLVSEFGNKQKQSIWGSERQMNSIKCKTTDTLFLFSAPYQKLK